MTPHPATLTTFELRSGLLRAVAIVAVALALMAAATALLGHGGPVPVFDLVNDPAGTMPF